MRCCGSAAAVASLRASPPTGADFQFHPHYRAATPLDAVLVKIDASLDDFQAEKVHDQIAGTLAGWSSALLREPPQIQSIEPLRAGLGEISRVLTADFQITSIDIGARVTTRVRYELVGTGPGFYREQRNGVWDLAWARTPSNGYRLQNWRALGESRVRRERPSFADVTSRAFGENASYSQQMAHGVDYWRTVLDGACGIDIYGHNGVSVGDIDGDGFDDVYVCQPAGLPNRLYRNRGDGSFEDVTASAGVGVLENTACALFIDVDNDGREDLVVVRADGPELFVNDGGGKFRQRPGAFQFANPPQGTFTGAAAADYDRDGWLDIYFCLYVYYRGEGQYRYPRPYYDAENGPPNFLMRNHRDATFRDVTARSGLDRNNTRYSFCCGWSDYNGDGWPDLYVVNDFGRKNLYRNNGDGTFTDVGREAGVEDVGAGMGVAWLDYDNDGAEDLYVADMWTAAGERITSQTAFQKDAPEQAHALYRKHAMGNSLFRNCGDGRFEDATQRAHARIGRWAWSSDTWDFDHDGFADLYVVNGMISGPTRQDLNSFFWRQVVGKSPDNAQPARDYEQGWNAINELIRSDYSWSGYERNVFHANRRDGTFEDISGAIGLDFREDGRAFALADFDHDGRQELLLKNRNAPQLRLMKNVISDLPPAIAFRLRGTKSNRDAIGAVVTIETASGQQMRMLQAGSGFLSQHSKELFFGLGSSNGPVNVSIRWPSGLAQRVSNLPPGHRIWIEEGSGTHRMEPFAVTPPQADAQQRGEMLPTTFETWLLVPVPAPLAAKRGLLRFDADDALNPETAAIYNLIYRYVFDRHRDMSLPVSFLIDEQGQIVKVYQGPLDSKRVEEDLQQIPRSSADRLAKALPFSGLSDGFDFRRNHLSLGSIYFQRGYLEQAELYFGLARRDDPASAEAEYGLGSVYLKQEKIADAHESFERTLKLTASYPDTLPNAWNNLGLLAGRAGRMDDAVSYFKKALAVSPDYAIALVNLGSAYRQQKQWSEARQVLERAVVIEPRDPEANYGLAMVFAQLDDTDRAYAYLEKALQYRPAYPEALNNLGVLYLRTRRRDQAVASFEQAMRVAPDFVQAYLNLARVYAIEGDTSKARLILTQFLKQHPGNVQAQNELEELR